MIRCFFSAITFVALVLFCTHSYAEDEWLTLIEKARSDAKAGRFGDAEQHAKSALQLIDDFGEPIVGRRAFTLFLIGEVYANQGRPKDAEPYFSNSYDDISRQMQAGRSMISPTRVCERYGRVLSEIEKYDEAEKLLRNCLGHTPESTPGWDEINAAATLMELMVRKKEFAEAESIANTLLARLKKIFPETKLNRHLRYTY